MKYIVKNCPCYIDMPLYHHDKVCQLGDRVKPNHKELYVFCADCTDCVIKQIVELCKHYKKHSDCGRDCPSFGGFLGKLLNKLDIEEINK